MNPKTHNYNTFDFNNFTFGVQATDNMLVATYKNGIWSDYKIKPFDKINISPISMALHYGQTIFEGLKAYRTINNNLNVFRLDKHFSRFNKSAERMAMPTISEKIFIDGILELIKTENNWLPETHPEISMYIRPFMFATQEKLGVDVSAEYTFMVVCSPIKSYYQGNLNVIVEEKYTRTAKGGVGFAKNGGNYGAALLPQLEAKKQGYDQILWLDAEKKKYIEESGTMNVAFIIEDKLITPPLSDTILDGITRDSLLQIARDNNINVAEQNISVEELIEALKSGKKVEAFGIGTAAVIAPFESITYKQDKYSTYTADDAIMYDLKTKLNDIRYERSPDKYNWNFKIQLD
ncbi:branched-chain amino acid aminotransferase [Flavobacterium sp. ARAG 55.4]|uniref:branched-chain amino acid aminotransferase n=1 Tax=Flavobacterium sp. ARAG 55.4 TaxID=3451357 RepID=UPI003F475150